MTAETDRERHTLFLTGRLAETRLRRLLDGLGLSFRWEIRALGSVAALMTTSAIERRLSAGSLAEVDRIIVPGLCGGDIEALSERLGVPVVHGPNDLSDLPDFLQSNGRRKLNLDRYDLLIFAEITEAPLLSVEDILSKAQHYAGDGADVIDLGSLPGREFPHMEEAIVALSEAGYKVSVDSGRPDDLLRAGRAGADYLLSLNENTLWIADEIPPQTVPVLLPAKNKSAASLYRAIDILSAKNRSFIADSILDPIHIGFTESLMRYRNLRRRYPQIDIMMGTGNLSELTEADTTGIHAMLIGIASELRASAVLTTEVSPHARAAVYEIDRARRIFYNARDDETVPKGYGSDLAALHDRRPFTEQRQDIDEMVKQVRDSGYRVRVIDDGVHVFNRDGYAHGVDPFAIFPHLSTLCDDPPHAFYMGVETARAQIAWQLGKRYHQDQELKWGSGLPPSRRQRQADMAGPDDARSTWLASRELRRRKRKSEVDGS